MKKLLSVSIAALAFAAVADGYTPITVGVEEIATTTDQQNYIIPVPYQTIGSTTDVSVHDLVKAANLPTGTKLYHYNGTSYQVWEVSGGTWIAPDVAPTAKIAGTSVSKGSTEVTIAVGSALWVVFGTGYPEADQKIYVYGSPVATKTTTISETGKTYLLSNPTDTEISNLAAKLSTIVAKGDKILPIGNSFAGYYAYNGTQWVKVNGTTIDTSVSLPALGAYAGFWYVKKAAGSETTITW